VRMGRSWDKKLYNINYRSVLWASA